MMTKVLFLSLALFTSSFALAAEDSCFFSDKEGDKFDIVMVVKQEAGPGAVVKLTDCGAASELLIKGDQANLKCANGGSLKVAPVKQLRTTLRYQGKALDGKEATIDCLEHDFGFDK